MQKAIQIAMANPHRFRFGCVVTGDHGRIIAQARNHMGKSHPVQAKYAKLCNLGRKVFLHAEICALIRCREEPREIFIARVWKDGTPVMAKPCRICELAIIESGIHRIHYTNEYGKITTVDCEM